MTLRHNSRLHHIGLGRRLAGTPVTVLAADLQIRVVHAHTGELIRELTLDPTPTTNPPDDHGGCGWSHEVGSDSALGCR